MTYSVKSLRTVQKSHKNIGTTRIKVINSRLKCKQSMRRTSLFLKPKLETITFQVRGNLEIDPELKEFRKQAPQGYTTIIRAVRHITLGVLDDWRDSALQKITNNYTMLNHGIKEKMQMQHKFVTTMKDVLRPDET